MKGIISFIIGLLCLISVTYAQSTITVALSLTETFSSTLVFTSTLDVSVIVTTSTVPIPSFVSTVSVTNVATFTSDLDISVVTLIPQFTDIITAINANTLTASVSIGVDTVDLTATVSNTNAVSVTAILSPSVTAVSTLPGVTGTFITGVSNTIAVNATVSATIFPSGLTFITSTVSGETFNSSLIISNFSTVTNSVTLTLPVTVNSPLFTSAVIVTDLSTSIYTTPVAVIFTDCTNTTSVFGGTVVSTALISSTATVESDVFVTVGTVSIPVQSITSVVFVTPTIEIPIIRGIPCMLTNNKYAVINVNSNLALASAHCRLLGMRLADVTVSDARAIMEISRVCSPVTKLWIRSYQPQFPLGTPLEFIYSPPVSSSIKVAEDVNSKMKVLCQIL